MKMVVFGGLFFWVCIIISNNAVADTWDLKIGTGPALRSIGDDTHSLGTGLAAFGELGLTRSLSLISTAGLSAHPNNPNGVDWLSVLDIGVVYSLDIFEVVPFAGIRVGWIGDAPGVSLMLGADYLWSEFFFLGAGLEAHEPFEEFSFLPDHVSIALRIGYRWMY